MPNGVSLGTLIKKAFLMLYETPGMLELKNYTTYWFNNLNNSVKLGDKMISVLLLLARPCTVVFGFTG